MTRLLPAMIVVVSMVFILGAKGGAVDISRRDGVVLTDWDHFFEWLCKNTVNAAWSPICGDYTTTTTTTRSTTRRTSTSTQSSSTDTDSSEEESTLTSASTSTSTSAETESTSTSTVSPVSFTSTADSSTSMSPSALQRAHWCRFTNGTHVPLGYTFMHTECALCQCLLSRDISCTTLQCMPTYCIDGSTPTPRQGQCCAQCEYENTSTACVINGVSFPHGSVLRRTSDNIQCWCQLGSVECRKGKTALFAGLDWWGPGSAVYVMVIIICAVLLFGTLLCCAGSLFVYYYYQRHRQQITQQAYEEYYRTVGWEVMPGDGGVLEGTADEKQTEAEQDQVEYEHPTGFSNEYIPPPYALYNGSYVNEPSGKDEK